jgi:hypothetical protein
MRATNGDGGGGDEGVGGLVVGGAALVLVLGGAYQATQSSQASEATPYIAGVVAIAVALITWLATDRRQAKALAAEQSRHEATLTAEHGRHEAMLRHDERKQDLEELRKVFDDTIAEVIGLNSAQLKAFRVWADSARDPTPTDVPERKRAGFDLIVDARWRVASARFRLAIRIGVDHEAIDALAAVATGAEQLGEFMWGEPYSDEAKQRYAELTTEVREQILRFQAAAYDEIQVRRDSAD